MSFQDISASGSRSTHIEPKHRTSEPSQALASGIFQMNTQVTNLKRLVNLIGSPKDTQDIRDKLYKTRHQLTQLAKETGSKLKEAQAIDHSESANRAKKVTDAKLARDFQTVLKEFQDVQRFAAERESQYPHVEKRAKYGLNGETEFEMDRQPLRDNRQRQEQLLVESELVYNEAVIEERELGIKEIQQQIGEVNEIFKDLAVLVKEQGSMIDDLEANVEKTSSNVQQANKQLTGALKKQGFTNRLTCWAMIVFTVAVFIFFLIMTS